MPGKTAYTRTAKRNRMSSARGFWLQKQGMKVEGGRILPKRGKSSSSYFAFIILMNSEENYPEGTRP